MISIKIYILSIFLIYFSFFLFIRASFYSFFYNSVLFSKYYRFHKLPYAKRDLNAKLISDLKTHHNVLGTDRDEWISETHKIFDDKTKTKTKFQPQKQTQ